MKEKKESTTKEKKKDGKNGEDLVIKAAHEDEEQAVDVAIVDEDTAVVIQKEADITDDKAPTTLNAYYGNRIGIIQSISLLLNAGLMIYAHVGLSAVVLSSRAPVDNSSPSNFTGGCTEEDFVLWEEEGGRLNRTLHSNFCSRQYNGNGCLLDSDCITECFASTFGYTQNCSTCFAAIPQCSFDSGCGLICAADSFSAECQQCNIPCVETLDQCLGFPETNATDLVTNRALQQDQCFSIDPESIEKRYVVYELTFINSIHKAWNGNARLLAFIVVLFSGIWPYAKNVWLMFVWYLPMSVERRTSNLTWLLRLSKYTLVDVLAVITVLIGVLLELDVGGTQVVIRAEPRPAILAFFFATVWEFTQIEWVVHCHNQHVPYSVEAAEQEQERSLAVEQVDDTNMEGNVASSSSGNLLNAMRFRTKLASNEKEDSLAPANLTGIRIWVAFLVVATLATYLAGATMELVRFTSFGAGESIGCNRSYNLVTFGNAMVSELALTSANSAVPGTWMLYVAYVILVLFLPTSVHFMQLLLLVLAPLASNSNRYKEWNGRICHWASSLWGFSSVEVLLMGIFSVQYRFDKFVSALAGNDNSQFFSVESALGPAFFILIGYSFASGILQYFIYCATAEYYKVDPYHKVHVVWTKLLGCWLERK